MPAITRVLETCLSAKNLAESQRFYAELFGFPILFSDDRLCAFDVAGVSVLLLFAEGKTKEPVAVGGGVIPPHDGSGRMHCAFAITAEQYASWRDELRRRNVPIESEVQWPRGGRSLYFRDPDQHLIELATPGLWSTY
jgi:catechol 2,3-dioxygenase-like lactoylglutathione lyase family enzyme